ncbi:glycosyltransferase family 2 protein [Beggiatoa leptomitoformis]|uniref:Glycosyltransferase n=1 Tax=Beggiatoa leptomitoformis TaxID=288004 RepID=A0A2N9YAT2_9GAMM|nr:glycosyltransferase family 2 protein [Beggiatoa leptomitoformis]ALG67068.1 glycosyltransferase [Beggiatoa leptomitoformis]AUI67544.1 glycosyltransferase [Beggiatoa leptomitoformis]
MTSLSIILPCLNESQALQGTLQKLTALYAHAEIIVVDDGSSDNSAEIATQLGATVVRHPYRKGNGAAIKTGARNATGDVLIFMDADGQHDPADIERLLAEIEKGHDMVVGARGMESQASTARLFANTFYNKLASWMVEQPIADLTSGFRAVRANKFKEFLSLLPNTFSYPTTITMAFFRAGYSVCYIPIIAHKRIGKSHIKILRDGIRFLLIIFKIGTLYAPLKLFGSLSVGFFIFALFYYFYTFFTDGRFTNMGAVLFTTSILIFLIGLVSEQITQLLYTRKE